MGKNNDLLRYSEDLKELTNTQLVIFAKSLYFTGVISIILYICKYNFVHITSEFNWFLLPALAAFTILPPFLYLKLKSLNAANWTMAILAHIIISFIVLVTGGLDSPGLIWITSTPILWGVLLGRSMAIYAFFLAFATTLGFFFMHKLGLTNPWPFGIDSYFISEVFDSTTFGAFLLYHILYFLSLEEKRFQLLDSKNRVTEELLGNLVDDLSRQLSGVNVAFQSLAPTNPQTPLSHNEEDRHQIKCSVDEALFSLSQVKYLKLLTEETVSLKPECLNVSEHIQVSISHFMGYATLKGVKIKNNCLSSDISIDMDRNIFTEVILKNLLHNAIKFSHFGSRVEVSISQSKNSVIIEVRDFGIGIPNSLKHRLFDFHSDMTRLGTDGEMGNSIGLPLVKKYLDLVDGSIWVQSETSSLVDFSRGSQFSVSLPISRSKLSIHS